MATRFRYRTTMILAGAGAVALGIGVLALGTERVSAVPGRLVSAAASFAAPTTIEQVIARAKDGEVIELEAKDYGEILIKGHTWAKPVTIRAQPGTHGTLKIVKSQGVNVTGGDFGHIEKGYAMHVHLSKNVNISDVSLTAAPRGLVISRSQNVSVSKARITEMRIDGINVAASQHVTIVDSSCARFNTGKAHPDCIQLWSDPKRGGTTKDVTLLRNRSDGNMQGFTAFNHVRDGVDDGGFDRLVFRDNWVTGYYPNGVAVYDCRNCDISNNTAVTPPDAKWHVIVRAIRCTDCTVEGNVNGKRPSELRKASVEVENTSASETR
ncbi:right-handed parallel beta-helix repeat-containing protein [Novosphingobium sp. YJ-S2-02]|uniref:Right-handed parallel beta-helix repeat-containing protein n=1 Tax=Novosphingobium aureum TaxID=2792964 RepID=A0A931H8J9_9SPHN|nr:right-handed parallel beta-helix repeat-containing protein [Novosphingobium aureum]MBH0111342.1 right-handed parallel beta-helix repeat-containing protein [Novosphingobium aureum]